MSFHFDQDMERRFLTVEISGFWTAQDMADFKEAAAANLRNVVAAGGKPGEGRILVIASEFMVQDKALTGEIGQLIPLYGQLARRIAVVGSDSAVQRLQMKRIIGSNAAVFTCRAEAAAWLFAADA